MSTGRWTGSCRRRRHRRCITSRHPSRSSHARPRTRTPAGHSPGRTSHPAPERPRRIRGTSPHLPRFRNRRMLRAARHQFPGRGRRSAQDRTPTSRLQPLLARRSAHRSTPSAHRSAERRALMGRPRRIRRGPSRRSGRRRQTDLRRPSRGAGRKRPDRCRGVGLCPAPSGSRWWSRERAPRTWTSSTRGRSTARDRSARARQVRLRPVRIKQVRHRPVRTSQVRHRPARTSQV